jgi:hypothetical protein
MKREHAEWLYVLALISSATEDASLRIGFAPAEERDRFFRTMKQVATSTSPWVSPFRGFFATLQI